MSEQVQESYKDHLMLGMVQDFQRQRIAMGDNYINSQQRLTGGLENACIRGIRPYVEPDIGEARALATMDSRIDPLSQPFHVGNAQVLAGIAENNALIRAKLEKI